jgi:hypothetical protein
MHSCESTVNECGISMLSMSNTLPPSEKPASMKLFRFMTFWTRNVNHKNVTHDSNCQISNGKYRWQIHLSLPCHETQWNFLTCMCRRILLFPALAPTDHDGSDSQLNTFTQIDLPILHVAFHRFASSKRSSCLGHTCQADAEFQIQHSVTSPFQTD